jgi:hypothetical protein
MTTQSTLGPFMTLILTLTAKGKRADDVIHPSQEGVVKSLLFARLVIEFLRREPLGYASPNGSVFRIGTRFER